jgi:hypothetical protein
LRRTFLSGPYKIVDRMNPATEATLLKVMNGSFKS